MAYQPIGVEILPVTIGVTDYSIAPNGSFSVTLDNGQVWRERNEHYDHPAVPRRCQECRGDRARPDRRLQSLPQGRGQALQGAAGKMIWTRRSIVASAALLPFSPAFAGDNPEGLIGAIEKRAGGRLGVSVLDTQTSRRIPSSRR